MHRHHYLTRGHIAVERQQQVCAYADAGAQLVERLSQRRGAYFSSRFEFPGRYTRWDLGFSDPPLAVSSVGRQFRIEALNPRGEILLAPIAAALENAPFLVACQAAAQLISGTLATPDGGFSEEQRSRQPSVFSLLRLLQQLFSSDQDHSLGLYGAFGYDLVFQFETLPLSLPRAADQRDLLLYLPDQILEVDHLKQQATLYQYEFEYQGRSTRGLARDTAAAPYQPEARQTITACDHGAGEYAAQVEVARAAMQRGDLFEVVLGQLFSQPCAEDPSTVFQRLSASNPAPYGALINLGQGEFLVAASPEMFVRVEGRRIETCPISGPIARGRDARAGDDFLDQRPLRRIARMRDGAAGQQRARDHRVVAVGIFGSDAALVDEPQLDRVEDRRPRQQFECPFRCPAATDGEVGQPGLPDARHEGFADRLARLRREQLVVVEDFEHAHAIISAARLSAGTYVGSRSSAWRIPSPSTPGSPREAPGTVQRRALPSARRSSACRPPAPRSRESCQPSSVVTVMPDSMGRARRHSHEYRTTPPCLRRHSSDPDA